MESIIIGIASLTEIEEKISSSTIKLREFNNIIKSTLIYNQEEKQQILIEWNDTECQWLIQQQNNIYIINYNNK